MYSSNVSVIQNLVKKRITPTVEECLISVSADFDSNRLHVRIVIRDDKNLSATSESKSLAASVQDDLQYVFSDKWAVEVEISSVSLNQGIKPLGIAIYP
ncbi:MAG: hypothetical protein U1F71_22015 [Verrucomicrobiaceae bacterium]